jgi:prolyl-tRNA synthetase
VHVVAATKEPVVYEAAEQLVAKLEAGGKEVLFDDRRKVSPGVKFGDAELIGVPLIVVVGKSVADGEVEVWDRRTGDRQKVALDEVAAHLA